MAYVLWEYGLIDELILIEGISPQELQCVCLWGVSVGLEEYKISEAVPIIISIVDVPKVGYSLSISD